MATVTAQYADGDKVIATVQVVVQQGDEDEG